ncbi:hypothetical protein RB596_007396 [Gaeumannomyces avenae]
MIEWIKLGQFGEMGLELEHRVAMKVLVRGPRLHGPGNRQVWALVQDAKKELARKHSEQIPHWLLFQDDNIIDWPPSMIIHRLDFAFRLSKSARVEVPWKSLHDSVKSKLMLYSHRAEELWGMGYRHDLIQAFFWHVVDDHFLSSTHKDESMFSSPEWAAENAMFEAMQMRHRNMCEDKVKQLPPIEGLANYDKLSHHNAHMLWLTHQWELKSRDVMVRHQAWRAIGARILAEAPHPDDEDHESFRLDVNYIKNFLKKELEHLVNFDHPALLRRKESDTDLPIVDAIASYIAKLDFTIHTDVRNYYVVWNPESMLNPPKSMFRPVISQPTELSGFPWPIRRPCDNAAFMADTGRGWDLVERLEERLVAQKGPIVMPKVNLVVQPMLVSAGGSWDQLGDLRQFSVQSPMHILVLEHDMDETLKALNEEEARLAAKPEAD